MKLRGDTKEKNDDQSTGVDVFFFTLSNIFLCNQLQSYSQNYLIILLYMYRAKKKEKKKKKKKKNSAADRW